MADDDSTGKVANSAELSGAYLMASTAATKISQSGETYTAFSGELIDLVRTGIPGCGDLLSVDDLFVGVREALLDKGLPLPQRRETDHGSKFHLFRKSALETWAKELYGAVPNIEPGTHFSTRMELHKARVHRPLQAGICGTAAKGGAESIVVSGGYRDDEDFGNTIIYTGHGGRDPDTGAQVKDQSPEDSGNAALIKSMTTGRPVRVIRGSGGDPRYSPPDGYSYDGLFRVTDFSVQRSVDGPKVILFRLENLSGAVDGNVVGSDTPDQLLGNYERLAPGIYAKRSHAEKLKKIYNYTCQVCETALEAPGNQRFAASVYIRALEYPHRGRDSLNNMLCLCPNDYNLFKFGALTIEDDLTVINQNDGEEVGNLIVKHDIDMANIRYHRTHHQRSR
jgi:predicted restriction endonuclease